jgi:hypothetical protein
MPTVLRSGPYRLFFYSGDGDEPPHVHVVRDENTAKFWLLPVRLQSSGGFRPAEVRRIQRLIEEHREELLRSWDAYFNE